MTTVCPPDTFSVFARSYLHSQEGHFYRFPPIPGLYPFVTFRFCRARASGRPLARAETGAPRAAAQSTSGNLLKLYPMMDDVGIPIPGYYIHYASRM